MWIVQWLMMSYGAELKTYATRNPSDKSADITLSLWNLKMETSVAWWRWARATIWKSSGKRYWEIIQNTSSNKYWSRGIAKSWASLTNHVWSDINGRWWYYDWTSILKYNNNSPTSYGASSVSWDVIWFALDMDAWTITCYKNNVSQGIMYTWLSGIIYPMACVYWTWPTMTANFWATPMTYTAPVWYNQWLYT